MVDAAAVPPTDPVLTLHVGGKAFSTRWSTIAQYPDCLLARAFEFQKQAESQVPMVWDRNPQLFECILDFMRTGRLYLPKHASFQQIRDEFGFWGFDFEEPVRITHTSDPDLNRLAPIVQVNSNGSHRIPLPLAVQLRHVDNGTCLVSLCLAWNAIRRSRCVWRAAQQGYRNICIYWKVRGGGTLDVSLLRDHKANFGYLADLDGCSIQVMSETLSSEIPQDCEMHDVYTDGNLLSSGTLTHVGEWPLSVTCSSSGSYELTFCCNGQGTTPQMFEVTHKGFRVRLYAHGSSLWWTIRPEGSREFDDADVRTLQDLCGFWLRVSFVYGATVFEGFNLPTPYTHSHSLHVNIYESTSYVVPPPSAEVFRVPSTWYRAQERAQLDTISTPQDVSSNETTLIVLLEEYPNPYLRTHPVAYNHPYLHMDRDLSSMANAEHSFGRLVVSW